MRHTHTHTYVTLPVSQAAYDEIAGKLKAAGYGDHFIHESGEEMIGLSGIALQVEEVPSPVSQECDCSIYTKLVRESGHMARCPKHILWLQAKDGPVCR